MGLQEKRLAQQIQQNELPAFQAEIKQITGMEPKIEILWDTFIAYDTYPLSRQTGSVFRDIKNAFEGICKDDFGKEALNGNLDTIKIENTDNADNYACTYEHKVLYIKAQLVQGVYHTPSYSDIQEMIEKKL
jgi:hypothetical protein